MPDIHEPENFDLDNRLADFVDRLLCGDSTLSLDTGDSELLELQRTVMLIKKAFEDSKPSNEVVIKTKMSLLNSWQYSGRSDDSRHAKTFWDQVKGLVSGTSYQRRRGLVFNLTVLVVPVLAVGLVFYSPVASGLTAAAGLQDNQTCFIIGMGIVLGVILLWLMRGKQ